MKKKAWLIVALLAAGQIEITMKREEIKGAFHSSL